MAQPLSPWQQNWELSEENCTWPCRPLSSHASASSGGCFLCKSGMLQGTINPVRHQDYRSRGDFTEPRSSGITLATNMSTRFPYWRCSGEWSRGSGREGNNKLMMHDKVWHAQWRMEKAVGLGRLPFPPLYPHIALCPPLICPPLGTGLTGRQAAAPCLARSSCWENISPTNQFLS